jgi:predicted secreted hydrolase
LQAVADGVALDLRLTDMKGPILQGDQGYSRKGPEPGNASYYYSLTRLESEGTVTANGRTVPVSGLSWKDHEYSTSALGPDQVGWDWFALQLDDGSELMVAQLRNVDGNADAIEGIFVEADGSTQSLAEGEFQIDVQDTWRSPRSGAEYPAGWIVAIPSLDLTLGIEPHLADQELNVSTTYWEGAVRVEGERAGLPVSGHGYVEMTGYAGSMQSRF